MWWETTRDMNSPSIEECRCCWQFVAPSDRKNYPTVAVDKSGNVKQHDVKIIKAGVYKS